MSFTLSESQVLRRLNEVSCSSEDVQKVSLWLLHYKKYNTLIVQCWLRAIKEFDPEKCLPLFYVCNELLQTSFKQNALIFRRAFTQVLGSAVEVVCQSKNEAVRGRLERVLSVWLERSVYPQDFVKYLQFRLSGEKVTDYVEASHNFVGVTEIEDVLEEISGEDCLETANYVLERAREAICENNIDSASTRKIIVDSLQAISKVEVAIRRREELVSLMKGVTRHSPRLESVKRPLSDREDSEDSLYEPKSMENVQPPNKMSRASDIEQILGSISEPFKKIIGSVAAVRTAKPAPVARAEVIPKSKLYDDLIMEYPLNQDDDQHVLSDCDSVASHDTVLQDENIIPRVQIRDGFQSYSLSHAGNLAQIGGSDKGKSPSATPTHPLMNLNSRYMMFPKGMVMRGANPFHFVNPSDFLK